MSKVIAALAAVEQVEAVRLAAAGGLPTRYAYGELWDRRGMDLQVTLLRIFFPLSSPFHPMVFLKYNSCAWHRYSLR